MAFERIFLSKPHFSTEDFNAIEQVLPELNSNEGTDYIELFENKISRVTSMDHTVVVSSGTAAIHLALLAIGIKPNDRIIIPTLTFAATAFPIRYINAIPILLDSEPSSVNIDPEKITEFLEKCDKKDYPKAIIAVDLFGRTCNYDKLVKISEYYKIPLIIDAAEALGSLYRERPTTTFGVISILSFNYNKIITTTGGGALVTNNLSYAKRARVLANQARDNFHWYEHSSVGYNYRMSPVSAALGISQINQLQEKIDLRRTIRLKYYNNLKGIKGVEIPLDSMVEKSNAWLTVVNFSPEVYLNAREHIRSSLADKKIESRYIWKPLHQQPVFKNSESLLNGSSDNLYENSLCLPSSSNLESSQIDLICETISESLVTK